MPRTGSKASTPRRKASSREDELDRQRSGSGAESTGVGFSARTPFVTGPDAALEAAGADEDEKELAPGLRLDELLSFPELVDNARMGRNGRFQIRYRPAQRVVEVLVRIFVPRESGVPQATLIDFRHQVMATWSGKFNLHPVPGIADQLGPVSVFILPGFIEEADFTDEELQLPEYQDLAGQADYVLSVDEAARANVSIPSPAADARGTITLASSDFRRKPGQQSLLAAEADHVLHKTRFRPKVPNLGFSFRFNDGGDELETPELLDEIPRYIADMNAPKLKLNLCSYYSGTETEDDARRRAETIRQRFEALRIPIGEIKLEAGNRRLVAVSRAEVLPGQQVDDVFTLSHEFGHTLGFDEEYNDAAAYDRFQAAAAEEDLKRGAAGPITHDPQVGRELVSRGKPTHHHLVAAKFGETYANLATGPVSSGTDRNTVMADGADLRKQHYVTIVAALSRLTSPYGLDFSKWTIEDVKKD